MAKEEKTKTSGAEPEKKERKKRERRPIQVPELKSLPDGPERDQFTSILTASKDLIEAFQKGTAVKTAHLREARRAINFGIIQQVRARKVDPIEKKMLRLEAKIAKEMAALAELKKARN